jgi:NADH:ubiquinone oxidoreductase subunit 5 (subunit L)/multisubunit Na+/H+ antiporter MnhA subunit
MAVAILGLFSNTVIGIEGAILLSLAHGFVSPALFICVGGVIYERTGTRLINYTRGLVTYMPVFTILFLIFTLANTGIPLTLNWLGEQLSLMGIWQQNPIFACLGATGIVLSACYSIFLYNRLSYGNLSPHLPPVKDINRREYYLLISLIIPTIVFGLLPNVILNPLESSVSSLLYTFSAVNLNSVIEIGSPLSSEIAINSSIIASSAFFNKINLEKDLTDNQIFDWLIRFIDTDLLSNSIYLILGLSLLVGVLTYLDFISFAGRIFNQAIDAAVKGATIVAGAVATEQRWREYKSGNKDPNNNNGSNGNNGNNGSNNNNGSNGNNGNNGSNNNSGSNGNNGSSGSNGNNGNSGSNGNSNTGSNGNSNSGSSSNSNSGSNGK